MIFTYGRREDDTILDPEEVNELLREDQTADIALIDVPEDVVLFIEEAVKPHVGVDEAGANALLKLTRAGHTHGLEVELTMSYTTAIQRGSSVQASVLSALTEWDVL